MSDLSTPGITGTHPPSTPTAWAWRFSPVFWTALFTVSLAINTLSVAGDHPELTQGWQIIGLGLLLAGVIGAFRWFTARRIFHEGPMTDRQALLALGIQITALLLLMWSYDASFVWFGLSLPYQIFGGLPRRQWTLPLAGILLILLLALLPGSGAPKDPGLVWSLGLIFVANAATAAFILVSRNQRDQLRDALNQLQQAHTELASSAAQAEELAVLRERTRIARMMHDDLGHVLVTVNIKLEAAQLLYTQDAAKGAAELEASRNLIREAMAELRHTIADLRVPVTAHDDIAAALVRLAQETQQRTGIAVTSRIAPALPGLAVQARETVWYVAREALTNVERHAMATRADLTLDYVAEGWLLRVADNGCGFAPDALTSAGHYGIVGMRERIQALSGTFTIRPGDSGGTVVEVLLPKAAQETGIHG